MPTPNPTDLARLRTLALAAATIRRDKSGGGDLPGRHLKPPDPHGDAENTYGLPEGGPLRAEMVRWFKKQQKAVLGSIPKDHTAPLPGSLPDLADWDDPMSRAFTPHVAATWDESGKAVSARLGLDPDTFNVTSPHLKEQIDHATFAFCASTNATTAKQLGTALADVRGQFLRGLVEKGEAVPLLTKRVRAVFENATEGRARRIAATETSRAYHGAQEEAALRSGVVAGFELLLSGDACPLCRRVATEAKRVRAGQPFAVIGHNPAYKDVSHPPLHPMCQCSMVEVLAPEYGGPPDPEWSETVVQPDPSKPYTPPEGKPEPGPEPGRVKPAVPPVEHPEVKPGRRPTPDFVPFVPKADPLPPDLDADFLKTLDLHKAEPSWAVPPGTHRLAYGGVVFDDRGRVLLREPKNHFGGYAWTFPKGGADPGEHPVTAGLREVREETGVRGAVIGLVPDGFAGSTSTRSYFFLMRADGHDPGQATPETESQRWVTPDEARKLIGLTTTASGRERDLKILDAALKQLKALQSNAGLNDHLRPGPAPPPAPAPPAKAPRKPRAPKSPKPAKGFPPDPNALTVVKALGGSTGAELVEAPDGSRYVRKRGANPDHLREECTADRLYQDLGAAVPKFHLYETPAGPVKLSAFLPDAVPLGTLERSDPKLYAKAVKDLRRHFAADALLGNWDVVGMSGDNVLVDRKGKAYRVDNGGSLRYRAQGMKKSADQWDAHPTELWTLRDPKTNPQTAKVFGPVKASEWAAQVRAMEGVHLTLPPGLAKSVADRMAQMQEMAARVELLTGDRFKDGYADGFCKHSVGLRKAGIAEAMPTALVRKGPGSVTVLDRDGRPFDHLRGKDSLVGKLEAYVKAAGGDYRVVARWMAGQAGSSWSGESKALKAFLAAGRDAKPGEYYWKGGHPAAARELAAREKAAGGAEAYAKSFHALHAFVYEYLTRADFENKDAASGTVKLMRTESVDVMKLHGLKPGDTGARMVRGAAESCSIFRKVTVHGSETTVQDVPLHRVLGTYWQERQAGHGDGAFLGDGENEFVCLLEGVPVDYVK